MFGSGYRAKSNSQQSMVRKEKSSKSQQTETNERIKRFADYLENRGCPVRLRYVSTNTDDEIRWIG